MAKTKISEFDLTPANNTDIDGINIAEGCAPSGINNAIRELMSQLKAQQDGSSGDSFTVSGTLAVTGGLTLDGSAGTSGQVLTSAGSGSTPTWASAFTTGMIMMWSGTIANIPSGWALCNGSNGTPDLRNRFVIGAHSDNAGVANTTVTGTSTLTGGSKDAIVVSHTHTATVTDGGHAHTLADTQLVGTGSITSDPNSTALYWNVSGQTTSTINTNTTGITVSNSTTGSSGTNANLPPYYALAFIMKT
jgi:hypothetical protein